MYLDDQLHDDFIETTTSTSVGWPYLNLFSLIFIALWSLVSLLAMYYLWYAFNLFQIEVQDITFEIIDFRTSEIESKPREIVRLLNLHDDQPARAVLSV